MLNCYEFEMLLSSLWSKNWRFAAWSNLPKSVSRYRSHVLESESDWAPRQRMGSQGHHPQLEGPRNRWDKHRNRSITSYRGWTAVGQRPFDVSSFVSRSNPRGGSAGIERKEDFAPSTGLPK